jgi:hypothetical protein
VVGVPQHRLQLLRYFWGCRYHTAHSHPFGRRPWVMRLLVLLLLLLQLLLIGVVVLGQPGQVLGQF